MKIKLLCNFCQEALEYEFPNELSEEVIARKKKSFFCPACMQLRKSWKGAARYPIRSFGSRIIFEIKRMENDVIYPYSHNGKSFEARLHNGIVQNVERKYIMVK